MTSPDVAQIVRGLTKAQREAMVHVNAGGCSYRWARIGTLEALKTRGLVGRVSRVGAMFSPQTAIRWPLTDLGQQVRAAITGEGVGDGS